MCNTQLHYNSKLTEVCGHQRPTYNASNCQTIYKFAGEAWSSTTYELNSQQARE